MPSGSYLADGLVINSTDFMALEGICFNNCAVGILENFVSTTLPLENYCVYQFALGKFSCLSLCPWGIFGFITLPLVNFCVYHFALGKFFASFTLALVIFCFRHFAFGKFVASTTLFALGKFLCLLLCHWDFFVSITLPLGNFCIYCFALGKFLSLSLSSWEFFASIALPLGNF